MRATQSTTAVLLSSLASLASAGLVRRLPPAASLPSGWAYEGCYTDVSGRTLGAAATSGEAMTAEACITFCTSRGQQYAGVEYASECYCGNVLAPAAVEVPEAECNMACSGDATQGCGGPSRLTVYYSAAPVGPQPNPGVNGYVHVGCYTEGTSQRALPNGGGVPSATMTTDLCTAACRARNFVLAGVEYGGECYCGNTLSAGSVPAVSGCHMLCNGNSSEICGGTSRLNLYSLGGQFTGPSSSPSGTATTPPPTGTGTGTGGPAGPTPTAPRHPATVGDYEWYGCRTEGVGARALTGKFVDSDTMDLDACAAACVDFTYFGVEYGRECYCGNSFGGGSGAAPEADCSFVCPGDQFELCGAGNRLSVYSRDGPAPTGTTGTTTTTPTSTPPPATGFPEGFTNQGCWSEGVGGRALPQHQVPDSGALTQQSCANACNDLGYLISGTEYSTQCFCSNALYNGAARRPDADCSMSCAGNAAQKCGGPDRLTIWSKGEPQVYSAPAPQTGGLEDWVYKGCYLDNVNDHRTFFWQLHFPGVLTPKMCTDRCKKYGYAAAGLEYGVECYCGDPANLLTAPAGVATPRPESECNVLCAGNASAICGGGSRLTTYFWEGTPLYSWTFPQTPALAGRYEHLIDGVTIPLMTQETVHGKVTFLSKWGTGPGNETGAYELDLSLVAQGRTAFRDMHLKTDVFCAAGVILPDRGGRQLNVGGWSGESTEGVRLYWPDGSPGTPGTRDWQEDVNQLSLQTGRWYPSAMVMANGSIMVIGGEVGSNGAAVPTIELLPYTGQAPLYMDWLDRTDPDNLYPFVTVLPQGGIFVAYYNEARILDENTFATTTTLPNIPGAVNDEAAGRTYPLEGTAVLLPQKAPYSEPLGVLICGGSSNGVSNALDNCVTIHPQAAAPEWVLERMPSPRVMPCMAPLPDGTYLVANGAHAGVAGFGLATGPNLNALIYDPAKPLHSRFTVAANTTIARLYHSEALTLLDGRVLISGSDPQDGVNPQEYRVEVFVPPYLLSGRPRPTFTLAQANRDWAYGATNIPFTISAPQNGGAGITVTLLGAVSSTHGNSMGARTLMPAIRCTGTSCVVDAPPNAHVCPPGWYQFFVLDDGIPAVGVYVRIGGDPAGLGNWPPGPDFVKPGLGPV